MQERRVQNWAINELELARFGALKGVPNTETLTVVCKGRNADIWNYVTKYVYSRANAKIMRRKLALYRELQRKKKSSYNKKHFNDDIYSAQKLKQYLETAIVEQKRILTKLELQMRESRNELRNLRNNNTVIDSFVETFKLKTKYCISSVNKLKVMMSFIEEGNYKMPENEIALLKEFLSNILCDIKKTFYDTLSGKSVQDKNMQSKLLENEHILIASEITKVVQECSLLSLFSIPSEPLAIEVKSRYFDSELRKLKLEHISNSLNSTKLEGQTKQLLKKINNSVADINEKLKDVSNPELVKHIKMLVIIQAESRGYECYTNEIQHFTEGLNKNLSAYEASHREHQEMYQKCRNLEMDVCKNINIMNSLLRQNDKLVDTCKEKKNPAPIFADLTRLGNHLNSKINGLLQANLTDNIKCLGQAISQDFPTDLNIIGNKMNSLLKCLEIQPHIVPDMLLKNMKYCKTVISYNELMLLQKQRSEITEGHYNEVAIVKQFVDFLELLNKSHALISIGETFIVKTEEVHQSLPQTLIDWWEQNAQFIPDIIAENKTLRQWVDILTLL